MVLGFYMTIWAYLGFNPTLSNKTNGYCNNSLWWNLLYIQNFQKLKDMCMYWTWFLANDMQFYIISPLILLLLWKQMDYIDIVFFKPYAHISSYLIGILVGYIMYNVQNYHKFVKLWILTIGWIIAILGVIGLFFGLYHVYITETITVIINTLYSTIWSIILGWIIFVCLIGQGGVVNSILSWKFWIPLNKLSYCAYLVNPIAAMWYFNHLDIPFHYQRVTLIIHILGFWIFVYVISFVVSITFERPMMAIEKFILQLKSKNQLSRKIQTSYISEEN